MEIQFFTFFLSAECQLAEQRFFVYTDTHYMGIGVRHAGADGAAAYRIPGLATSNKGTLLGVYDVRYNNSADLQAVSYTHLAYPVERILFSSLRAIYWLGFHLCGLSVNKAYRVVIVLYHRCLLYTSRCV